MQECLENVLRGRKFKKVIDARYETIRNKWNLKQIDLEILYYMSKVGHAISSTEISKNLILNKGQVSLSMDRMSKLGIIKPTVDKNDKRVIHFSLEEKSKEIIEDISKDKEYLMNQLFKGISQEEINTVLPMIEIVIDNMDKFIEREINA